MNYVLVIPAKNEENIIANTIENLICQTLKPLCVLVVDNDSTDKTAEIVKQYASQNPIVRYFNYKGDNTYALGGKIVKIFHAGKAFIDSLGIDYEYIVKIDADTKMGNDTFERISLKLSQKNYGIVSPLPYHLENGRKVFISTPEWHTSGDFKVYKRHFIEAINGLPEDLGWDCADNVMAIEKGFDTEVFSEITYEQTRPIGRYSLKKGWKRQGVGAYKLRYDIFYLSLKCAHDIFKPPFLLGSMYYLSGYFSALLSKESQTINKAQRKILRKLFWSSLMERFKGGKFYVFQRFRKSKK